MHAGLMRLEGVNAVYGEERLLKKFPPNFRGLFVANDKAARDEFTDRCVGPFVSARGSFTFERDAAHQWLMNADVGYSDAAAETDQLRWAMPRLGSIKIDAFALFYSNNEFIGFWIEASENDKKRVLTATLEGGSFNTLPDRFQFTSDWIAKALADLF